MGNVPNLRFPEFSGEWENCQIANILSIGSGRDYKHLEKGNIPVFGTGGYMTSVNECIQHLLDEKGVSISRSIIMGSFGLLILSFIPIRSIRPLQSSFIAFFKL